MEWFDPVREAAKEEAERERKRRDSDNRILALRGALVYNVPENEQPWRVLLGHLLEYHRREARQDWWKYFDRLDSRLEELVNDDVCLGGLTMDTSIAPRQEKRSKVCTLRFPEQDTKLRTGDFAIRTDTGDRIEIVGLDEEECRLELKFGPARQVPTPTEVFSLIPDKPRDDSVQREAIERYALAVIDGREAEYSAVTSVLRRDRPRLRAAASQSDEQSAGESAVALRAAIDAIVRMDETHLVIQGPPGTGKTFTSAHAIVELLALGKRVGVTAQSHKAINNALKAVEEAACERGVSFRGAKKSSEDPDERFDGDFITNTTDNDLASSAANQLMAGTAWLFSRQALEKALDYLFIDEAGQVSLANLVAMGASARNIVLVGDQMQLTQPAKAAHPGGSGVSALDHLMQNWATVPPDRGIFLARTWRMHPEICRFISDAFYDGRLQPAEVTTQQRLILSNDVGGTLGATGLRFVEVQHEGNTQRSEEEAASLKQVYAALLGQSWTNHKGETREITSEDILVVSPYNMQVNLLKNTLPRGSRVGTVDKFQGQEAAVVLISLASSHADNIPRGLEFLLSPNRLNVAISRARCLSVVYASPLLLGAPCQSVNQVRLVNKLCWALTFAGRREIGRLTPPSARAAV